MDGSWANTRLQSCSKRALTVCTRHLFWLAFLSIFRWKLGAEPHESVILAWNPDWAKIDVSNSERAYSPREILWMSKPGAGNKTRPGPQS